MELGHVRTVRRTSEHRRDVPIDFSFIQGDLEVGLGSFSRGVLVGPGSRLPRVPALCPSKRLWRLQSQWHLMECRVQGGGERFINTVGTFGVGSASCYQSRAEGFPQSGDLHSTVQHSSTTLHILMSDDFLLGCGRGQDIDQGS